MSDGQAVPELTTRTTADADVRENNNDVVSGSTAQREDSQFDDTVEMPEGAASSEGYKRGEVTFCTFGPISWHPESASAAAATPKMNSSSSPADSIADVHAAASGGKCLSRLLPELGLAGEQFAPLETNIAAAAAAAASYPVLTVDEIRGNGGPDMGSSESVASYSTGRFVT